MKQLTFPTMLVLLAMACQDPTPTYQTFAEYPVYLGKDLGLSYSPAQSIFKLWAPPASEVKLNFYTDPMEGEAESSHAMQREENGVWTATFSEDLLGKYYTFQTKVDGNWGKEVPDPYVKAVGTNGLRGQVVDLATTNPEGWAEDQRPPLANFTDIILYELHIRDVSMAPNSGIEQKGKFLGLTERGTRTAAGDPTGLDHIIDLGVTHVHLLPAFDFLSVDESKPEVPQFNWGYDPQNYNVPEGSYSTNPADGAVRIREFKQLIKTMHDNGLRVVMDVVYNHTGATEGSNFNQLVPGYYYRQNEEGGFSNASACGNETASERPMVRKFMVESMKYWAEEYHIDGFRVDLMGIHDIETMNRVSATLHQIDPTIVIYGEGWTAGGSPLPENQQALKKNTSKLDQIAAFSDDIRDAIKGHVFTHDAKGFISGLPGLEESLKFGIVASTQHPQVDYTQINYSKEPWAPAPFQTITYVSCHDNNTLWDRLTISCPEANEEEKIKMQKLAGAIVLTSQGISFLHAGVEMLRTKGGVENSFASPDSVNQIDWFRKTQHRDVFLYFRDLISLRKNHPAFRIMTSAGVQAHLKFLDLPEGTTNLVAYQLSGNANGDPWRDIVVVFNGNEDYKTVDIPEGNWTIVVDGEQVDEAGLGTINTTSLTVPGRTAMVLKSEK